ncbi:hypothetical protein IWQ60_000577 [Tieghemiomyces parasiticus]|uniref:Uncharacterized protein n=1 Tax=Tieghemiomyces parasiticus TaxID=78921 RepID=A0A9W8ALE2_9FUNG|nr:hypothetical protein IWQ60_000577 [Tieghemiomyces parasiticus]
MKQTIATVLLATLAAQTQLAAAIPMQYQQPSRANALYGTLLNSQPGAYAEFCSKLSSPSLRENFKDFIQRHSQIYIKDLQSTSGPEEVKKWLVDAFTAAYSANKNQYIPVLGEDRTSASTLLFDQVGQHINILVPHQESPRTPIVNPTIDVAREAEEDARRHGKPAPVLINSHVRVNDPAGKILLDIMRDCYPRPVSHQVQQLSMLP